MSMSEHAAQVDHHYTTTGIDSRKVGFWVLIGSESLFFGSLIATYMIYKGQSTVGPYAHGAEGLLNIPLTSISTFVLLMSSLAMVLALHAVQSGNRRGAITWLFATAALGSLFLGFQAFEFTHFWNEGLTLDRNLFGSSFFVLTGFHGAHVAVGVVWLLTLMGESLRHNLPPSRALTVEIAGLYWHFVDVVWIVIFTLIYLIE
jgi:cytochrome c oxidase subunit 3/cytochrome o ubiquinol oxidase subunit 3